MQRWIGILLAAYGAGLLVGSPIAAWFADRGDSRQGPYLWGLIALAASTVAFSLGQSTSVLFVGRLVQGASSAVVHTVGNTILADTVGEAGVGPAMGLIGMSIAFGVLIGPVVGGVLYHNYGYLAVFVSAYAVRTPIGASRYTITQLYSTPYSVPEMKVKSSLNSLLRWTSSCGYSCCQVRRKPTSKQTPHMGHFPAPKKKTREPHQTELRTKRIAHQDLQTPPPQTHCYLPVRKKYQNDTDIRC